MNISFDLAKQSQSEELIADLNVLKGKMHYYACDYITAKKILDAALTSNLIIPCADDLYYLGAIEGKLGRVDLQKKYFKEIDSILNGRNYPIIDNISTIYQFLLKDAIQNNDAVHEKEYLNRLVYYDTLLANTQERLRKITLEEFDLPMEAKEKRILAQAITTKNTWLKVFYGVSVLLLLSGIAYYLKYRNTQKRLDLALNHPVTVTSPVVQNENAVLDKKLNEAVLSKIILNLEAWENDKGFLDSTVNQQALAKQLGTNSAYLSQTINLYKGQNFSSYLKDQRITYAINTLKENPNLVKDKSMIQLAELFGFNSISVFAKAFKTKLGITPGVFIKGLSKE